MKHSMFFVDDDTMMVGALKRLRAIESQHIYLCDICDTKCTKEMIQAQRSLHICSRCKTWLDALPSQAIRNLARFFSGNVV